jgi:glycosyltransferase involved in cell wall biosynthesis
MQHTAHRICMLTLPPDTQERSVSAHASSSHRDTIAQPQVRPVKVAFVLLSSSQQPVASTRIAALNILPFLRAAHFDPHIVFEPAQPTETPDIPDLAPRLIAEGFRIVVFQKVHGPSVEKLLRQLSAAGVKTAFSVCDRVNPAMAAATDLTITVSEYLKSLYLPELQRKIRVVHDGVERGEVCKSDWRTDRGSREHPLRALLVTSHNLHRVPVIGDIPEWLEVTIVGRYAPPDALVRRAREVRWKLAELGSEQWLSYVRFLAHPRIRCLPWDRDSVYEIMQRSDIGIIPIEDHHELEPGTNAPRWKVKSENRLTMKMCVGLPVIASPIPSYEAVIEHGRNGFLAQSRQEWSDCLDALRDPTARLTIGQLARETVLTRYSMEEQARRLIDVLRELAPVGVAESAAP